MGVQALLGGGCDHLEAQYLGQVVLARYEGLADCGDDLVARRHVSLGPQRLEEVEVAPEAGAGQRHEEVGLAEAARGGWCDVQEPLVSLERDALCVHVAEDVAQLVGHALAPDADGAADVGAVFVEGERGPPIAPGALSRTGSIPCRILRQTCCFSFFRSLPGGSKRYNERW